MPILRDPDPNLQPTAAVHVPPAPACAVTTVEPKTVRVASSAGGVDTAPVTEWVGTTRPPHAAGYLTGFFSRYMDPTEITNRFVALEAEFGDLADIVNLPNLTHGYRRNAQTVMGVNLGAPYAGQVGNFSAAAAQQAVILESRRLGPRGRQRPVRHLPQPGRGRTRR